MSTIKHLLAINLHAFDGDGGAAGAAAATAGDSAAPTGDVNSAVPGAAGRGKKTSGEDLSKVIYGRQPDSAPDPAATENDGSKQSDAGSKEKDDVAASPDADKEALRKEYRELTNGRLKDIHTEETQRMIDRRFKAAKETDAKLQALQPALETLAQHYGITDDSDFSKLAAAIAKDDSLITDAAEEAGMSTETYRQVQSIKRENAVLKAAQANDVREQKIKADAQRLKTEADALKAKYPQFDIREFTQDRDSMAAFMAGQPLENVYWASHHDELLASELEKARTGTAKNVADNIRAKGQRPAENGAAPQGAAFITKSDPSKLTLRDFEEISRRVRNGEVITY